MSNPQPDIGSRHGDQQTRLSTAGLLPPPRPRAPVGAGTSLDDMRDSYRGALIGTAIGDALGRPAEQRSPRELRQRYGRLTDFQPWPGWMSGPKGTVTDDTQMTMCVAECLVANDARVDPADLARRFVAWLPIGRGKGRACVEAVSALARGVPWVEAGVPSAGNGAAMRAAPVGLAHVDDLNALRKDAALSAVVTHAHPTAVVSAVAHAWLVARLASITPGQLDAPVLVADLHEAIDDLHDPGNPERGWEHRPGKTDRPVRLADRLAEVPELLDRSPEEASDWLYCGVFVLESLPMALWHFLHAIDDPERAVVDAVMGGHDADTVASMTGAYIGAYLGHDAFPARWVGEELEFADRLRQLADELLELCMRGPERDD
jgi:ADP-ribosylglycohydrolase